MTSSDLEAKKAAILDKCCQSVECLARGKVFDLVGTLDLPQSSSPVTESVERCDSRFGLLPCPFCGSPARTDLLPHAQGPGWAQCSECECSQHMSDTLEEAVLRWNRRDGHAQTPALPPVDEVARIMWEGDHDGSWSDPHDGQDESKVIYAENASVALEFIRAWSSDTSTDRPEEITKAEMDAIEAAAIAGKPLSSEQLDALQFGRVLHKRPVSSPDREPK